MLDRAMVRWWTRPFPYERMLRYGRLVGLMDQTRKLVAVSGLTVIACSIIAFGSADGPSGWEKVVIVAFGVLGVVASVLWWRGPWPSRRVSLGYVAVVDIALAFGLSTYADPLSTLPGTSLFTLLGLYLAFLHSPRALLLHTGWTAAVVTALTVGVARHGGDSAMATSAAIAVMSVAVVMPIVVQIAWSTMRREAWRSLTDPLTGLLNRRGLYAAVAAAPPADGRRHVTVVAVADLDAFKAVNDAHGHATGDEVLRRVTARLEAWPRGGYCARTGGEEMTIYARIDPAFAPYVATEVAALIHDRTDPHPVTASVGVTVAPGTRPNLKPRELWVWFDDLAAQADAAMYEAKRQGGNRGHTVHLDPDAPPRPTAGSSRRRPSDDEPDHDHPGRRGDDRHH